MGLKPGWKSTEWLLTALVVVVALLNSSGVVGEGSTTAQAIGYIVAGLTAMGYTSVRGGLKKKLEVVKDATPVDDTEGDS